MAQRMLSGRPWKKAQLSELSSKEKVVNCNERGTKATDLQKEMFKARKKGGNQKRMDS